MATAPTPNPTVTASYVKLSATVQLVELSAAVSAAGTQGTVVSATASVAAASVSYVELIVLAGSDETGRYPYIEDAALVTDAGIRHTLQKAASSQAQTFDIVRRSVVKALEDQVPLADQIVRIRLSDEQLLAMYRKINESVSASELASLSTSKQFADGVGMNDLADLIDGLAVQAVKSVVNVVFAAESLSQDVGKGLGEFLPIADLKAIEVQPRYTESTTASDLRALAFGTARDEQLLLSDAKSLRLDGTREDLLSAADASFLAHTKILGDAATLSEVVQFLSQLVVQDALGAQDSASLFIGKLPSDFFAVADASDLTFSTNFYDAVWPSDQLSVEQGKGLSDGVGMVDVLPNGVASQVPMTAANVTFASDQVNFSAGLTLQEQSALSESGRLVSQSYSDVTYFEEDYVGSSRFF